MDFPSPVQITILGLVGSGVTLLSTWAAARFRGWSPSRPLVVNLVLLAWIEVMFCGMWGLAGYSASASWYVLVGPLGFCWTLVVARVEEKLEGRKEQENWGHNWWLVFGIALLACAVWMSRVPVGS